MRRRDILRTSLTVAAAAIGTAWPARAGFPDRPITLVTGYAPGGSTDVAARILADRMPPLLGPEARMVVENRPGAAGVIATEWLKRQPADGYTLMVTETGAAAAAPAAMVGGTRYDPVTDFTQIGLVSTPPGVLVVTPGRFGTAPEDVLAALRQAAPDSLTYASSGVGGVLHLRSEMLAQHFGTRYVHVPYRSGAQMVQSIMTGESQFGIAALASANPLLREGKLQGVAMIGSARFPHFPDIPTMAELGIPGFDDGGFFLLIGPAGIPLPVAEALNTALRATLADPKVQERLIFTGHMAPDQPNTLSDARAFMVRAYADMQAVVQKTGVRLQP